MTTLLHIDSSINGQRSHSRKVTATFAEAWRTAHPDGTYLYRDLGADPIPHMDALTHGAHHIPESEHTPNRRPPTAPVGPSVTRSPPPT